MLNKQAKIDSTNEHTEQTSKDILNKQAKIY